MRVFDNKMTGEYFYLRAKQNARENSNGELHNLYTSLNFIRVIKIKDDMGIARSTHGCYCSCIYFDQKTLIEEPTCKNY
jgi:hypothetical protein